jgi:uncharacterized OB-fold protein
MEHKLTFKDYTEALKEDRLLGLKCHQCDAITVPPRITCSKCQSPELEVVQLSGKGTIQTFTTIYVPPEGREAEAPYTVVLVELDEGPWLMGNLGGVDPTKLTMDIIGKRVKMGHAVSPGDKFSAGELVRPLFYLES